MTDMKMNIQAILFFLIASNLLGGECSKAVGRLLTEKELRIRGFEDEDVAGLDRVQSYLGQAELWRNQDSIDARTTHLPFLAGLIDSHIDFIRSGIRTQNSQNNHQRLDIMDILEREAYERRETEQVTYRWWVLFNLRLALLTTSRKEIKSGYFNLIATGKDLGRNMNGFFPNHELLDGFPEGILAPIINGRLGIFSINRVYTTRVYPLGLINKGDSFENPHNFFNHDVDHATSIDGFIRRWKNRGVFEDYILFHRAFLRKMDNLSPQERRGAELVYFTLSHEHLTFDLEEVISGYTKRNDLLSHTFGEEKFDVFKKVAQEIKQEL